MTLITLTADRGHFKRYRSAGLQQTYRTPPVSTVVGIIKRIYGEDIKDFIFGYRFRYKSIESEIVTIHKEVNSNVIKGKEAYEERIKAVPQPIECLIEPMLEIVIDTKDIPIISENLNMGKTDFLAIAKFKQIDLERISVDEENVLTHFTDGQGVIERLNKETVYNEDKGYYDYYTDLFRFNEEYECEWSWEDKGFYLWNYKGMGDVKCYKE